MLWVEERAVFIVKQDDKEIDHQSDKLRHNQIQFSVRPYDTQKLMHHLPQLNVTFGMF